MGYHWIMAEWLTLLLLFPAIVVPVALLVGFAGCDRVFGLTEVSPPPLIIDSATGKDGTTITLIWHSGGTPQSYQFERTDPVGNIANFDAPAPAAPFDDTGLAPATSYRYRVRAIDTSGDPTDWSAPVTGTTLPFASTYAKTLTEDGSGWEGYTLVQRIEAIHLSATGPHVRISVQASSVSDASIDRIYISQADSTGNPYDSAADLTLVYDSAANQQQPFVVLADTKRELPIVAYTINKFQALLIAVDFAAAPASGVEYASSVQTSEATAYFLATPAGEAAVGTRSPNYQQAGDIATSDVIFITNVEVG
jgi:hypothetical protein